VPFFESVPDLYLLLDADLRILDATDAYLDATMTTRDSIVGRKLFDVFPDNPDDVGATGESNLNSSLERVIKTLKPDAMAIQKYDVKAPPESGGEFETRYWSPVNTPVLQTDGRLSHIVHRVEDVTAFVTFRAESDEQKADNLQLRGDLEAMQADILRRSEELHDANVLLRAASDAKNMFLSRMSHELRSPLTAVIGYSELLTLDSVPGDDVKQGAEAIFRAGTHLLELINQVLDISQVESGHMTFSLEPVPLENSVQAAREFLAPFAKAREISLTTSEAPTALYVKADAQRLTQVLTNLVSNAIKYNRVGGRVSIDVGEPHADRVRIAVTDTGPGISEEGLSKLFRPFERLGAESTEVEGTGLGLSLSRALVEQMEGKIGVESETGTGSTFWVELSTVEPRLVSDAEAERADALAVVEYSAPKVVLYVEDTAANVRLVEQILSRRPQVSLISATLGILGLELAREHLPDLILLDLHLPDVNGSEVLARLKADDATRETPVAILSADATKRQNDEVLALGAATYLTKPIRIADLLRAVDQFLR
jgi:signal transduction histidine kinase